MCKIEPPKIAILTSTRAEFGILSNLIGALGKRSDFKLQLIVTGTHLSEKHGSTINGKSAEYDFDITAKVPMPIYSDDPEDLLWSASELLRGISDCLKNLRPKALIILGDRFEMLQAAFAASYYA